ncbi:HD-GYP domain-containing protein [Thermoanaerobacterium thermosaccharolyticum]|uniref:HD-GYP domain-containing protein n=1 Tax=Thermoanaerobacterium thermosaccharolyticum TaxID=1517 RepID=UPI001782EA6D|nr:HD-GYP domain-containing protein [Thermoanaerobacterium thermosaccharolyticum]
MTIEQELKKHHIRTARLCEEIAKGLNMPYNDLINLLLAAQLHDIGKLKVPEKILMKPDKLTEKEMEIMKKHTVWGYEKIKEMKMDDIIADAVLHHHERYNGKGYPEGLKGNDIPYFARIITIADAYDVMINERVYKKALSVEEALKELINNAGTQFDPILISLFVDKINK